MAQHKYDLVTVPTKPTGPPKHHPWYKERLDLKFLKRGRKSATLDGRKWTLLAGDIDDFRSGVPAHTSGGTMRTKGTVDLVPLVDSSHSLPCRSGRGRRRKVPPHPPPQGPAQSTLHTKVGPRRQTQQAHLQQLEDSLLQHPLGLYPHLEEAIPEQVLEDVVGILDPELRPKSSRAASANRERCSPVEEQEEDTNEDDRLSEDDENASKQATIYRWPLRQSEEEKREEEELLASQKVISPAQESRVNAVTHNLVQWGRDLGGNEPCVVDEATVKNLFAGDYETRPMTAPIHVVDLANIPLELRGDSRLSGSLSTTSPYPIAGDGETPFNYNKGRRGRKNRSLTTPGFFTDIYSVNRPRYVKSRYGAWYLPTNLWRLQWADEPLQDPKMDVSESEIELARQNEALDRHVAELHGAQAFRDYYMVNKPGARLPPFLLTVKSSTERT